MCLVVGRVVVVGAVVGRKRSVREWNREMEHLLSSARDVVLSTKVEVDDRSLKFALDADWPQAVKKAMINSEKFTEATNSTVLRDCEVVKGLMK